MLSQRKVVRDVQTLESHLSENLLPRRLLVTLTSVFAFIALLLAAGGIYALMAYSVGRRKQEFGIRIAMGAQKRDIVRLVLMGGVHLTLLGVAAGLVLAVSLTPWISHLLFSVGAHDPLVFFGTVAMIIIVALAASLIPTRRATRVEPIVALRQE